MKTFLPHFFEYISVICGISFVTFPRFFFRDSSPRTSLRPRFTPALVEGMKVLSMNEELSISIWAVSTLSRLPIIDKKNRNKESSPWCHSGPLHQFCVLWAYAAWIRISNFAVFSSLLGKYAHFHHSCPWIPRKSHSKLLCVLCWKLLSVFQNEKLRRRALLSPQQTSQLLWSNLCQLESA